MSKPLAGADLVAFHATLTANKATTERDRIILCAIARLGRISGSAHLAKMCGGVRGVTTRAVDQTLARHGSLVAAWAEPTKAVAA